MSRARLPVFSAVMSVEPDPPKQSRIISPRLEQSLMASAIIATGLTVGCIASSSPLLALIELMPA